MANSRDDEVPEVKAETSDTPEGQKEFTRRALLQAGWVVPAVTAINIPEASAQSPTPHNDTPHSDTPHNDTHGDSGHRDNSLIHTDVHLDTPPPSHSDFSVHTDPPHADTPHTATTHQT